MFSAMLICRVAPCGSPTRSDHAARMHRHRARWVCSKGEYLEWTPGKPDSGLMRRCPEPTLRGPMLFRLILLLAVMASCAVRATTVVAPSFEELVAGSEL